ncbi:MAG: M28 family peptidase, partial [Thermoplasmatales archaeon]|nr:M28 family peptidase [Thermoplasmatales archaeon]
ESVELAKGRAFGTKGEHKAADILLENMTKLGLYAWKEQIQNIPNKPDYSELTHGYQVSDYKLKITNTTSGHVESVDCQITLVKLESPQHGQVNYFNFSGLKIKKRPTKPLQRINAFIEDKKGEDYVLIKEHGYLGFSRNPNATFPIGVKILHRFFYPIKQIMVGRFGALRRLEKAILKKFFPNCKGLIIYDFTDDTRDISVKGQAVPNILINGTIGRKIVQDTENYTVDFYLKQRYNESIISYNVIGQLNGTNPNKTIIVDCLYDSVWCQGTGDSAIGMGIVMGIAKYFTDHNITPKYNIKFIGFGGEETGCRGARYYEAAHKDENITHVIDMNQVGFDQKDPRLTLNLICNKYSFMNEVWKVAERTDYVERTGNTRDIAKRWWPEGAPSDDATFGQNRPNCKTVCFLTDFPWIWHHRDGLNHTEGDVFKYFDRIYTSATGEIALNVTLAITVEEDRLKSK